jgi:hypothetical protein
VNKPRRPRSDTVSAAVRAMQNAALPDIEPLSFVRLREQDRDFWSVIIRARARDDWQQHDLVVAAQLARCMRDIETESEKLDIESTVVENARGTMVANPRVAVLEQLARREMALMRSLRMGGKDAGNGEDLVAQRNKEQQARAVRSSVAGEAESGEDALLA